MPEKSPIRTITQQSARPRVKRRVLQLAPEQEAIIHPSELVEQFDLLVHQGGTVHANRYSQVESVYTLAAEPTAGQHAEVTLTPEVHHGALRNRYTGMEERGIFLTTPSRERNVFELLQLRAELAPGELIVIGRMPDKRGSLGYLFHSDRGEQQCDDKLILVRLLRIPTSDILASR